MKIKQEYTYLTIENRNRDVAGGRELAQANSRAGADRAGKPPVFRPFAGGTAILSFLVAIGRYLGLQKPPAAAMS